MPRPVDRETSYLPGLDGIRGLALTSVLLFHLSFPFLPGGLLGVGVFFTLSGFLITGLLLKSVRERRSLELRRFWIRRARRLLPAATLTVFAILLTVWLRTPEQLAERGREALAALLYVANWHDIRSGADYFANVSPFAHFWSLSIEEQFYLGWPLLLGVLLFGGYRVARSGPVRRWVGTSERVALLPAMIGTLVLIAASSIAMATAYADAPQLAFDSSARTRAYEGTDTRAAALLIGCLLAMWWFPDGSGRGSTPVARRRPVLTLAGVASLLGIGTLMVLTDAESAFLYQGGQLLLAGLTCVLMVAAGSPGSPVARWLSIAPLRWLGERSYGIYLWHLPVIAFTPENLLPTQPVTRGVAQLVVAVVLGWASWELVEDPIRTHGFGGLRRGRRFAWRSVTGMASVLTVSTGTLACTSALPSGPMDGTSQSVDLSTPLEGQGVTRSLRPTGCGPGAGADRPECRTPAQGQVHGQTQGQPQAQTQAVTAPGQTSCQNLVHIGESTSLGLMSPAYLPPADRVDARYGEVGVRRFTPDILGARSISERFKGQANAEDAAMTYLGEGFDGCWVIAMGTNDSANVHAGSTLTVDQRIDLLMARIGQQPSLWTTTKTIDEAPKIGKHYHNREMVSWNEALLRACRRYPTMRVYDWAAEAKPEWYTNDGIHFTSAGYRERALRLAGALATAFPQSGAAADGCLVRSGR